MAISEYIAVIGTGIATAILGGVLLFVGVTTYGTVAIGLGFVVILAGTVGAMWNAP